MSLFFVIYIRVKIAFYFTFYTGGLMKAVQGDIEKEKDKIVPEERKDWATLMESALDRLDYAHAEVKTAKEEVRRLQKDRPRRS